MRTNTRFGLVSLCVAFAGPSLACASDEAKFNSPDILVLGDSQMTFGAGPEYLDLFQNLKTRCSPNEEQQRDLQKLGDMSVAVMGIRSTSLSTWTARSKQGKSAMCRVDPKWKVNAGTFGIVNTSDNKFVQIGEGPQYQFCKKEKTPFETMFKTDYYKPKLLILSYLGNSAGRWAKSKKVALRDVTKTMEQIPSDLPCIFMTTAPAYSKKHVKQRLRAQKNIRYAFQMNGSRCSFVDGYSAATIVANLGNKKFFRLNKRGKVKDPFHPNSTGAKKFISLVTNNICNAVFDQLKSKEEIGE